MHAISIGVSHSHITEGSVKHIVTNIGNIEYGGGYVWRNNIRLFVARAWKIAVYFRKQKGLRFLILLWNICGSGKNVTSFEWKMDICCEKWVYLFYECLAYRKRCDFTGTHAYSCIADAIIFGMFSIQFTLHTWSNLRILVVFHIFHAKSQFIWKYLQITFTLLVLISHFWFGQSQSLGHWCERNEIELRLLNFIVFLVFYCSTNKNMAVSLYYSTQILCTRFAACST